MTATLPRTAAARHRTRRRELARRRGPAAWITLTALVLLTVGILVPFALIALNAFKPPAQYSAHGPLSFPNGFYTCGVRTFWDLRLTDLLCFVFGRAPAGPRSRVEGDSRSPANKV